jgi:MFS family permease
MPPRLPGLQTTAGADVALRAPSPPSKWTVLVIVGIGVFMCTLDSSIVNVSLPAIARHFGGPVGAAVEWVIIAYLVVIAALLLTIGRLSDRVGHRALWQAGLVVFTVGSALCGAAPALGFLIGARVLQGVGGALLMAISPAMLTSAFPPEERGRALGLNATIVALGVSAGPTLGGVITELASWRWIAGAVFGTLGAADAGRALLQRPGDPALAATFVHGYRAALLVCAGIAALGIVTSLLRGSEHRR